MWQQVCLVRYQASLRLHLSPGNINLHKKIFQTLESMSLLALNRWRPLRWCCCPAGAWKTAGLWWRNRSGSSDSGFLLLRCRCPRTWWSTDEALSPRSELWEARKKSTSGTSGSLRIRFQVLVPLLTCRRGALSAFAALFAASVERETLQHLDPHGSNVWGESRGNVHIKQRPKTWRSEACKLCSLKRR